MIAFLNGRFLPEEEAKVSIFDRSFLYGDGLFETLPVHAGRPFRWSEHWARLEGGAQFLGIDLPFSSQELAGHAAALIEHNAIAQALLRITVSRGVGRRGYSPRGANQPTLSMSLHEAAPVDLGNPARWRLVTSSLRVASDDPLARVKSCNKLRQILARTEAESLGADEAILLNTDSEVAEAASSNLFWVDGATICTPPLVSAALPGVTRAVVLEVCAELGISSLERSCSQHDLYQAQGVFLSLSSLGIVEAVTLDARELSRSDLTTRLHRAYHGRISRESLQLADHTVGVIRCKPRAE